MKKTGEEELGKVLMGNQAPQPRREQIEKLKAEVLRQAVRENLADLERASLPDRMLRQIPYVSFWVWAVQGMVLVLTAAALKSDLAAVEPVLVLGFAAPVLALLLAVDIVRSWGSGMWEMEAACRHDLRQVTAMRMCVVGAVDLAVLGTEGLLYRQQGGSLWEFGLLAVVPFFLNTSVYLWELNHFSRRCSAYVLGATGVVLNLACISGLGRIRAGMGDEYREWLPGAALGAAVLFGGTTVYGAVRLCRGLKNREGEDKGWSLE